jgi:hypothetical protein
MAVPLLWDNGLKGSSRRAVFISAAIWLLLSVLFSSCEASDEELKDMSSKNLGVEEIKNADINYTLC